MISPIRVAATLSALCLPCLTYAQQREVAEASLGAGKVSVSWSPTDLRGRSVNDITVGMVWRMSAGEAAQLKSDVPVLIGGLVLPPGEHRLSAKRVADGKWHLLVFRGAAIYIDGMPAEETPVEVAETKESAEALTFKVEAVGRRDEAKPSHGKVTLRWGKHELRIPVYALSTQKIDWSVGGEPAELEFYGLPRNRETVARLRSGAPLRVGVARIGKTDPITVHLSGQARGMEVDLVLQNASLLSAKSNLAANEQMISMLEGRMEAVSEQQKERIKGRIASLAEEVKKSKAAATAASRIPESTTVEGTVELTEAASEALMVDAATAEDGITLKMRFGGRTATFKLDESKFRK